MVSCTVTFYVWLFSLSILLVRFIHVCSLYLVLHSFSQLNHIPLYGDIDIYLYMWHLFIHSLVDGYLRHFHICGIAGVICALNNTGHFLSERLFSALLGVHRSGMAGSSCSILWGAAMLFSTEAVPFCIPTNSIKGSSFSLLASTCLLFWPCHSAGRALSSLTQGLNPHSLQWKLVDLNTGLPGNSPPPTLVIFQFSE